MWAPVLLSLQGANLQSANLENVDLKDSALEGANLQHASLKNANIAVRFRNFSSPYSGFHIAHIFRQFNTSFRVPDC
jgi:uncharacterized protein YjbI with pentapeptide repeats